MFVSPHVAVETRWQSDQVDPVFRRPRSFLVRDEERAVVVHAHAVGGTKAIRENLRVRAVLGDLEQRAVMRHERRQRVAS